MDKDVTKRLLRDAGIKIARYICLTKNNKDSVSFENIQKELGLPFFIKPANAGSSVGVHKDIRDGCGGFTFSNACPGADDRVCAR